MKIIYSFLDEVCQIWCIGGTYRAFYLIREFITIVKALSECLYLIAIASKTHNVFCTIMLKIEHKINLFIVECYTHIFNFSIAKI